MKAFMDTLSMITSGEIYIRPNKLFYTDNLSHQKSLPPLSVKLLSDAKDGWRQFPAYSYSTTIKNQKFEPWSFLLNCDYNIYYNGLKIKSLASENIEAKFNIDENHFENENSNTISTNLDANKINWFEIHPKFFLNGEEINYQKAMALSQSQLVEHNGSYYMISDKNAPSIKALEWFWSHLGATPDKRKIRGQKDKHIELPKNKTLELLALRSMGIEINGGVFWNQICEYFDNLNSKTKFVNEPKELNAQLKNYQKYGFDWLHTLYSLKMGAILADDMGLGKTIQTLTFLEKLREEGKLGNTLIVVPTSLTYNWISESMKFTPNIKFHRFQSKKKEDAEALLKSDEPIVIISSYGLFNEQIDFFRAFRWNIHIYDEAQNLKNLTSKRTASARSLPAQFKLCLTGTPLENHYDELYSLVDLAVPGSLGTIKDFRKSFISNDEVSLDEIKFLKMKIKPLVLRRTKKQILKELPEKSEIVLKIPFDDEQKKIYRDIALSWNDKVKQSILERGEKKSQVMMLTALLRLRQACSDPSGIPNTKYKGTPPKLKALCGSLEQILENGDSALVFTQFISTLQSLEKEFSKLGIKYFSLHGSMTQKQRETVLENFKKEPKGSVLIMTLKTGGVGLNLVKANYVFHLEPWWNPAVENQANDRTHRIGQKKNVTIYRYLMKESVEEKVELLKDRKAARFSSLFSDEENIDIDTFKSNSLSTKDFEYLLT
jgi:SNF2 family DNA or RNA helicase